MNTHDDGGSAFPHSSQPLDAQGNPMFGEHSEWGMTLRDYFAAAALQGCIEWERMRGVDSLIDDDMPPHSQPLTMDDETDEGEQANRVAKAAYIVADSMLAARKEGKP